MNWTIGRRLHWLACSAALALISCGGGSSAPATASAPTLTSIALSPATASLGSGGTGQLTVTGHYSDGSTQALSASGESFVSSNPSVAVVSASGVATVAANATAGQTATITATDKASGLTTSAANSTVVSAIVVPTLSSIALSPSAISLAAGASSQLSVTAHYSDGSTQVLAVAGEAFSSSNPAIATVGPIGNVTVAAAAAAGATATISATDTASGISTSPATSSTITVAATTPTLASIALSPSALSLGPGGTGQLTVTATYSDSSTKALAASGEVFQTSNVNVAVVSAAGNVSIAANAAAGATASIGVTDASSGVSSSQASSTVVTVVSAGSGPPTAGSGAAAAATAQSNAQCTAIQPFYWEIGDASGALASGSSTAAGETPFTATTKASIASASKWIYGMYVVQMRGGATKLTPADIEFLTFTSGYTYMGSDTQSATCTQPPGGADSINYCLTLPSATATAGEFFNSQNPATLGVFDYDGGHEENHAGQFQPEINTLDTSSLGNSIAAGLGISGITLRYNQPLLAGGVYASANDYTPILRSVVGARLGMLQALGTNPVCAWTGGSGCNAAYSPIVTEHWHYSIAHWVEDDPTNGDGAFSSPGAFGFYPWVEANKKYYGVISRSAPAGEGTQNGLASAQCGRELRAAWETGTAH